MNSRLHTRSLTAGSATAVLLAALVAAALLAGDARASAAAVARSPRPATTATAPVLGAGWVSDWGHVLQVVAWRRHHLPQRRVVYYFGGSAVRESVASESSWAAQTRRRLGRSVTTYVLASKCQTFAEDRRVVNQLPKNRGVVLIGVGLGRFTTTHKPRGVSGSSTRSSPPGPWYQHHYDAKPMYSTAKKRTLVRLWLADRYHVFTIRYENKLDELETLIKTCQARGLRVALVEMPVDLPLIGHRFDAARRKYQPACARLASTYGIEYLRFVAKIGLRNSDFYDLAHLLPSGRAKWQGRLARELVWKKLLRPATTTAAQD